MVRGRKRKFQGNRDGAARIIQRRVRRKVSISNKRLAPVMRALVDRRVRAGTESHEVIGNLSAYIACGGAISGPDFKRLLPSVGQGDTRDARDGAKIKLRHFSVRGFLKFTPPEDIANHDSMYARLFMVSNKDDTEFSATPMAALAANLLRSGGNSTSYTGTLWQHWMPVNTAYVTKYYDKSFRMIADRKQKLEGTGTDPDLDLAWSRKQIFIPFFHKFKVKGKILRYQQGATFPVGYNPVIGCGVVDLNNPGTAQGDYVQMAYQVTMRWDNM